jgi:hypothetical protein
MHAPREVGDLHVGDAVAIEEFAQIAGAPQIPESGPDALQFGVAGRHALSGVLDAQPGPPA